ncbi:hypothetical protein NDU88_007250 [Pleurodeles waltl]|uniref:Secreted protein n=1 Tax=Pleurodeles waltl TaxID=8319 RepID=A0AAV7SSA5_PLEWA|nr:hypothetical protein NDU88_007250 [Pleurodeles waltl]
MRKLALTLVAWVLCRRLRHSDCPGRLCQFSVSAGSRGRISLGIPLVPAAGLNSQVSYSGPLHTACHQPLGRAPFTIPGWKKGEGPPTLPHGPPPGASVLQFSSAHPVPPVTILGGTQHCREHSAATPLPPSSDARPGLLQRHKLCRAEQLSGLPGHFGHCNKSLHPWADGVTDDSRFNLLGETEPSLRSGHRVELLATPRVPFLIHTSSDYSSTQL